MNRLLLAALAVPALAGCGTSASPTAPAPAAAPPSSAPTTSASAKGAPAQSALPEGGNAAAPGKGASPSGAGTLGSLRELAARYVQSDGRGGWRINEQAATDLEKLDREQIARFVVLLSDQDAQVRRGAAFFLLGQFNPNDPQHVAAFSKLLADSDATVRGIGLSAAREMNQADQVAAAPDLAEMLGEGRESKPENRASIARLLGSLKSQAASVADQLAAAAKGDPNPQVRNACLVAIANVAAPADAARLLAEGLRDEDASVRLVAAARLRQLGADAAPAANQLAAALEDSDARVADAAAQALVNIGKRAADALAGTLEGTSGQAKKLALACLIKIGPGAGAAAPAAEKCLQDADPQVRQLAEAAVERMKAQP